MNRPETRTDDAITDRPTITDQVVSLLGPEALGAAPTPPSVALGKDPGTTRRPARRRVRAAPSKRVPDFGPDGDDLFDAIDLFSRGFVGHCRHNLANIGVVVALLVLIVAANWATQPAAPPSPVAQSLTATDTADVKTDAKPSATPAANAVAPSEVSPSAEPLAEVAVAKPPMTATAQVTEKTVLKPVAPVRGVTLQAGVTLRAELDPAKPLPAQVGKAAVSPVQRASQLPRRTLPLRATRPRVARRNIPVVRALASGETAPDPFTSGGAHDLDGPTAREQYQQLNKVTRRVHATRGN